MSDPQLGSYQFTPNPPRPSFFRRLFSWRTFGRCLIGLFFFITLIALFLVEENWRGKRAWETYKRQAEARGLNFDRSKVIPAPVPDRENFALTPFLAPLLDFNPSPLKPGQSPWRDEAGYRRAIDFATNLPPQIRTEAPAVVLADLLQYAPVMDELSAASRRLYSRFNIDYTSADPEMILVPHDSVMRRYLQLFQLRAFAELSLGQTDAALADVDTSFRIADSIRDEPLIISQSVRLALFKAACLPVRQGLTEHRWSDSQLVTLEKRLAAFNFLQEYQLSLDGERVIFGTAMLDAMNDHRPTGVSLGRPYNLPGWVYFEQVNYQRALDETIRAAFDAPAGRIYPSKLDASDFAFSGTLSGSLKLILRHKIFATMLGGPFFTVLQKTALVQTDLDQIRTVCALERFRLAKGTLPETLDALVPQFMDQLPRDLFTGDPLKYRRAGTNDFVLYSVGWNQKDDGGKNTLDSKGKLDFTQGDWVWPLPDAKR